MDMQGEQRIPAPREKVWEGLNDPEILKQCIPGCKSLDVNEDGGFDATVSAKVGPVKANFKGSVKLENINAPESYTITGEGKGGAAGFAKGGADVTLEEDGDETVLRYTVKAQVGGKLAQLGGRLIDSTAKKYATDFFKTFNDVVAGGQPAGEEEAKGAVDGAADAAPEVEPTPMPSHPSPMDKTTPADEPPAAPAQTAGAARPSEPVQSGANPHAEVDDGLKEAEPSKAPPGGAPGSESHVKSEAAKASNDAVDGAKESGSKPGLAGLSPLTWTVLVVVLVLVLLLAFSM